MTKGNRIIMQDVRAIAKHSKREAKALEGKTLVITGGSGFLGKYFLYTFSFLNKYFFAKPLRIISVDNFITGQKAESDELLDPAIEFIQHDVREFLPITGSVDYIIHAAGIASPVYYMKFPLETLEVATLGTKNMLELARVKHVKSFLFFSSSEIYGDPDPNFIPTPETYPGNVSSIGPRSCYDESKRLGETLCMIYHKLYKVPAKIVRPFNIYGPGMRSDDYRVIPRFLTSALKKEALQVHAGGNQTRAFCYIADGISGFLKVLLSDKSGEVYNVGNDENEINMMSLAKIITELLDNKVEIKSVEYPQSYPQDDPRRRCPDLQKIRSLGYTYQVNIAKGLKRTLNWYKGMAKMK